MKKEILILCTGNSCRSIMAEALVEHYIKDFVFVESAGVNPLGEVNPEAKRVLKSKGLWQDKYHSKSIDEFLDKEFDLVVTVCDNAKESCPNFENAKEYLHMSFDDPSGKEYSEYQKCFELIKKDLLPSITKRLGLDIIL